MNTQKLNGERGGKDGKEVREGGKGGVEGLKVTSDCGVGKAKPKKERKVNWKRRGLGYGKDLRPEGEEEKQDAEMLRLKGGADEEKKAKEEEARKLQSYRVSAGDDDLLAKLISVQDRKRHRSNSSCSDKSATPSPIKLRSAVHLQKRFGEERSGSLPDMKQANISVIDLTYDEASGRSEQTTTVGARLEDIGPVEGVADRAVQLLLELSFLAKKLSDENEEQRAVKSVVSLLTTRQALDSLVGTAGRVPPIAACDASTQTSAEERKEVMRIQQEAQDELTAGQLRKQFGTAVDIKGVEALVAKSWPEATFQNVAVVEGSPMADETATIAFALTKEDLATPVGLYRQALERYPEMGEVRTGGSVSFREVRSAKVRGIWKKTERGVMGVLLSAGETTDLLHMAEEVCVFAGEEGVAVSIPKPTGVDLTLIRKIFEITAHRSGVRVKLHVPMHQRTSTQVTRSEAVMVKTENYALALKEVHAAMRTQGKSVSVQGVRKTRTGDLLLTINQGNTEHIAKLLQGRLGEGNVLKLAGRGTTVPAVIRNIPQHMTADEICLDLREGWKLNPDDLRITGTAINPWGTQTVWLKIRKEKWEKLPETKGIRVGIAECRAREWKEVVKCSKCWEHGHSKEECSGPDYGALCRKCGKAGHRQRECGGERFCLHCNAAGHSTYSKDCPGKTTNTSAPRQETPEDPQNANIGQKTLLQKPGATAGTIALPPQPGGSPDPQPVNEGSGEEGDEEGNTESAKVAGNGEGEPVKDLPWTPAATRRKKKRKKGDTNREAYY